MDQTILKHRPLSFDNRRPNSSYLIESPIVRSASPASLNRSQSLREKTVADSDKKPSRFSSIHRHSRSKSQVIGMDNGSRSSLDFNVNNGNSHNHLNKSLISSPILNNPIVPMYLRATYDETKSTSSLTTPSYPPSSPSSPSSPSKSRDSFRRTKSSSPKKVNFSSSEVRLSPANDLRSIPQLSPQGQIHTYTQVLHANITTANDYSFPSKSASRTSLTSPTNLPPMDNVWLDEDDEDDIKSNKRKSLSERLRREKGSLPTSSSMNALPSLSTTTKNIYSLGNSSTNNVSIRQKSHHKSSSNSLGFSKMFNRKRSLTADSLQISQPIMAVPVGSKSVNLFSPEPKSSLAGKHKHSSSLQSNTSSSTVTISSNHSRNPSSASKILKSFFTSPTNSHSHSHSLSPSKNSHSRTLSKDLISNPVNFVHRSHLDHETTIINNMPHSTSISKELDKHRSKDYPVINQKSPKRPQRHLRENSTSSSTSVSTAQGSIVNSISSANTLQTTATTPISAVTPEDNNSVDQFIITNPINSNPTPSIPPRQQRLSFTKEGFKSTPSIQQVYSHNLNKQQSVDSFGSWTTPNSDFVEQQRWLLNNTTDIESTPSTPSTTTASKTIRKNYHSSQESFWNGYMNSSPSSSSAASTTSTTTNATNTRRSVLLPSPLLSSTSISNPPRTSSDFNFETSIQHLRIQSSKSDLHDVEEEEEDKFEKPSSSIRADELTWF